MRLFVNDLKTGDILVNHNFAVKEVSKKVSKNNNEYYTLVLSDKTGDIEAKIWSDNFSSCDLGNLKVGAVISITGKVDSYNSNLQIIIDKCKKIEDFEPSVYLQSSEKDKEKQFDFILNKVKEIEDTDIKSLINNIISNEDLVKKYKNSPAAEKVHHFYIGGLLDHVVDMIKISESVKDCYPELNYSELLFGIIFHDIGKVEELLVDGVVVSRSVPGYLLGHITQGAIYLNTLFPKDFNEDKKFRLLHLILSHHGQLEYGSPVKPMTLEALALSYIDDISSQLEIARGHLKSEELDEKGMTGYSRYLGSSLFSSSKEMNKKEDDSGNETTEPGLF